MIHEGENSGQNKCHISLMQTRPHRVRTHVQWQRHVMLMQMATIASRGINEYTSHRVKPPAADVAAALQPILAINQHAVNLTWIIPLGWGTGNTKLDRFTCSMT